MGNKLQKMQSFIPSVYYPTTNTFVRGLLYAWSGEDDIVAEQIQNAKEQLYVRTALLQYLDTMGSNVGVFRPTEVNLADDDFRRLIPALSFWPKQVVPTIKEVLAVFFGDANPQVKVFETNLNEVVIQIPSTVPSLRRGLKGAWHIHAYTGTIVSIDNLSKEIVVNLDEGTKTLKADELKDGYFTQGYFSELILSNEAGRTDVLIQFPASANLSDFDIGLGFTLNVPGYPNSYIHDPTKTFSVTSMRGILGQSITAGASFTTMTMQESSNIPDGAGFLSFNFGRNNEESRIRYYGRPTNTSIVVDPSYVFTHNHVAGEMVNVVVVPYVQPNQDGTDYGTYWTGVVAARVLAQSIIQSIVAAGVVVRWIIVEPQV